MFYLSSFFLSISMMTFSHTFTILNEPRTYRTFAETCNISLHFLKITPNNFFALYHSPYPRVISTALVTAAFPSELVTPTFGCTGGRTTGCNAGGGGRICDDDEHRCLHCLQHAHRRAQSFSQHCSQHAREQRGNSSQSLLFWM